jgi:hypothetical protein
MSKLIGVRSVQVEMGYGTVPTIHLEMVAEPGFDARLLYEFRGWEDYFPGNVIVKCQFCSTWGATKTICPQCGGSVD